MEKIKIVDNALPQSLFDTLCERLFSPQISWFYGNTAYKDIQEHSIYGFSFEHLIADNGVKNSPLFETVEPILTSMIIDNDTKPNKFIRIRLGMIMPSPDVIIHNPHVDFEFENKVGLFYLNTTNGPTQFYSLNYDTSSNQTGYNYFNKIQPKISDKVECKANRLVLFNGLTYHSSSTPTNVNRRLVLSFNYV